MNSFPRIIVLSIGSSLLGVSLLAGVPQYVPPNLQFNTKTRQPKIAGVPPLIASPVGAAPTYYKILEFSGYQENARGPLQSAGAGGTSSQSRSELSGRITYVYQPATDDIAFTNATIIKSGEVTGVPPWPSDTQNWPQPPVLTVTVPLPTTTSVDYGQWYISANNPLNLPVLTATTAGQDNLFHGGIFGGNTTTAAEWHHNYQLELKDPDSESAAEGRAKVTVAEEVRDPNLQYTIRGTLLNGSPWTMREVEVNWSVKGCGDSTYIRRIFYQERLIGQTAWQPRETIVDTIELKNGRAEGSITLPLERGHEIRLEDMTFEVSSEGCSSCAKDGLPGNGNPHDGSIIWQIPLGLVPDGGSAGFLTLYSPHITAALYTPAALVPAIVGNQATVIKDVQGAVRQVLAPQALADLVTTGAQSYEIRYYDRSAVGAPDAVTGIYAVTGSPYQVHRVENPDAGGAVNRWRVTRTVGSHSEVTEVDESVPGHRIFSEANGLRITETVETTEGPDRVETIVVKNAAGAIASTKKVYYRTFAWGEERVKEILDPAGAALTTEWTYYTNPNSRAYRKITSIKRPDGFTETITLDPGTGWQTGSDQPLWKNSVLTTSSQHSLIDLDADGLTDELTVEYRAQFLSNHYQNFTIRWGASPTINGVKYRLQEERRAVSPGVVWNAASNIITRERYYFEGLPAGELAYRLNPDGTLLLRRREINLAGGTTTTEEQGAADAAGETAVDGIRTVQVLSARGWLVSSTVIDIATGRTLQAQTVGDTDQFGRPTRLLHLDGAEEVRGYCLACGSVDHISLRGETVDYEFDALHRKILETRRAGATVLAKSRYEYDAEGRLTRNYRVNPADNTETLLAATVYDLAGRIISTTSLQAGATSYAYAFGADNTTITTTTYADGGTRIETRGASGTLVRQEGTVVPLVAYDWGARTWYGAGTGYLSRVRRYYDATNFVTEESGVNFLGEMEETTFPDGAVSRRYFDSLGRLNREVDQDGVTVLHGYDARGRQAVTAVDLNGNNTIDYAGTDRITRTLYDVAAHSGTTVQRTTTQVWESDGQDTPTTVSVSEQSADGLDSWQTVRGPLGLGGANGLTTASVLSYDGNGGRTVTTTSPDAVVTTQVYLGDRLQSTTAQSTGIQLGATTNHYDDLGRLDSATDARTGATTYTYDANDRLRSVTTPDPALTRSGAGYDPQTTTYDYDVIGRLSSVTQPDGGVVHTTYWPHGQVKRAWGSRTYPGEYTYDIQLRVKTLTTWQDFAGDAGKAVTTWNYNPQRGWLDNKRYADNTGPGYAYWPSGRLRNRYLVREGRYSGYYYNSAGEVMQQVYNGGAPQVDIAYDRAGRPKTITDGSGTRTLTYDASGQLKDEDYTAGLLNALGVHRTFDSLSRVNGLAALSASSAFNQVSYGYDAASRLDTVTSGVNSATYGYLANSQLVESVTFRNGTNLRLITTKAYDNLNRLAAITNTPSAASALSAFYQYNSANQRTRATREDNAYWNYGYDALGQITSGKKFQSGGAPLNGFDFAWTYDDIGNRRTATVNSQSSTYTPTLLNTYSSRTVPGVIEVLGEAQPDATVTTTFPAAGGTIARTTRQGGLFYKQLTVDNSTAGQYPAVKITGVKNLVGPNGEDAVTEVTKSAFVAHTPETFSYDADGNLTDDARWHYTWDSENRLSRQTARAEIIRAEHRPRLIEYAYDGQSRRVQKRITQSAPCGVALQQKYYDLSLLEGGVVSESAADVLNYDRVGGWHPTRPAPVRGYSIQWAGTLRVPATGEWTIKLEEGTYHSYRLWLDGVVRFSIWPQTTSTNGSQTVTLTLEAGRDYALQVDVSEPEGTPWWAPAVARLKWSGPGTPEELVPAAWSAEPGTADTVTTTRYLYDGWNLLAEVNDAGTAVRTHVWGLDLSGTIQGAGGVGGLLLSTFNAQLSTHAPAYDGNGNVIAYVDMASGAKSATYEYTAFGETMINDGAAAAANAFRFSTKYTDDEAGFIYYGHRYYNPSTGRWPNQDPIIDPGFVVSQKNDTKFSLMSNGYMFVGNDPLNAIDRLGLTKIYGNWCGPDWTGGRVEQYCPHPNGYYKDPSDNLDTACQTHDICYYQCRVDFSNSKSGRSVCFRACDRGLTQAAYAIGGFWGQVIGAAIDRSGTRDPGSDGPPCCSKK